MPLNVNISQAGEAVPAPGVTANYFRAGAVVTITATDVDGTASAELLWRPEEDSTATLTPGAPGTWTITPSLDVRRFGGSYRIRITDDSDVVYRTFSVPVDRSVVAGGANTIDGLQIPSPMETGDNAASLDNLGAEVLRRSESNAGLSPWPLPSSPNPYSASSPWGWWRYLRDIIKWLSQPLRYLPGEAISIGLHNADGNDYNATRFNTIVLPTEQTIDISQDKGKAIGIRLNTGQADFLENLGQQSYVGALVRGVSGSYMEVIYHGLAVIRLRDEGSTVEPGRLFKTTSFTPGYEDGTVNEGNLLLAEGIVLGNIVDNYYYALLYPRIDVAG